MKKLLVSSIVLITIYSVINSINAEDDSNTKRLLNLHTYLKRVRIQNETIVSAQINKRGVLNSALEADLILQPVLYGNISAYSDSKVNILTALQSSLKEGGSFETGIRLQNENGWLLKANINTSVTHYPTATSIGTYTIPSTYYESALAAQLVWPFMRNANGNETKALQSKIKQSSQVSLFNNQFKIKQILFEAESTYWLTVLAQEVVSINKNAMQKSQKIFNIMKRNEKLGLVDKSDVYQAEAALKSREVILKDSQNLYDQSERELLSFLGKIHLETRLTVLNLNDCFAFEWKNIPKQLQIRDDIRAAEAQYNLMLAEYQLQIQNQTANLDLTMGLALNQWDTQLDSAFRNSFSLRYPGFSIALIYSRSLDETNQDRVREGAALQAESAKLFYEGKVYKESTKLIDLQQKIQEYKLKLDLAQELEDIQEKKYLHEYERYQKGKTTLHQTILFEQDYILAQLDKAKIKGKILQLICELKTYQI